MISPAVFTKHKCDAKSLRTYFEFKDAPKTTPKQKHKPEDKDSGLPDTGEAEGVKKLRNLFRSRIQEGRATNLLTWKDHAAVDLAYEAAYHQTTPTLMRHVSGQKMSYTDSLKAVKEWGMNWDSCFRLNLDASGSPMVDKAGNKTYSVNAASLVQTMIPLVKAYATIRCAKIYTDRAQIPLFKFEPQHDTVRNKLLCEILTGLVQGMVVQFGYTDELKDIILHDVLYGICLTFPKEAWFTEKQELEDGKSHTVKAGLRYLQPHPTRMFYDLMHRTSSFNSDSGCQFAGHWRVVRYSDVMDNKAYYNRGVISLGRNWFDNTYSGAYFSDFYPCTAQFPVAVASSMDGREERAAIYSLADADKAVFVTDLFCKIIPKDFDLGTYTHPVWFRFVLAADDTVIYAEPLAYTPVIYFGYDADGNRVRNPGMGLELVPHQDLVSNLLSQIHLTAKQNLANVTFYDRQTVKAGEIESLNNSGELALRGLNFVSYDGQLNAQVGLNHQNAFHSVTLPKGSVSELIQALNTQISICERMLSFSAQELGSAASHQQSKAEIVTIAGSVSVRVSYTASFIDDGIDAWKLQLAYAAIAYMDADFAALVSPETPDLEKHLKELGFEMVDKGGGRVKAKIKANKKAFLPLLLEGLTSTRDGPDRGTDAAASQVQMQTWQVIANNQMLAEQIGVKAILKGMEQAAKLGGAPDDFKLDAGGSGMTEAPQDGQAIQQAAQQIQQGAVEESLKQVSKLVEEHVVKPAAERMAQQQQMIERITQEIQAVARGAAETQVAVQKMEQLMQAAMQAPPVPAPQNYDSPPVPDGSAAVDGYGAVVPPQMVVQP